jgi:hypothetical protein
MRETEFHTHSVQKTELWFRTFQYMRLHTAGWTTTDFELNAVVSQSYSILNLHVLMRTVYELLPDYTASYLRRQ